MFKHDLKLDQGSLRTCYLSQHKHGTGKNMDLFLFTVVLNFFPSSLGWHRLLLGVRKQTLLFFFHICDILMELVWTFRSPWFGIAFTLERMQDFMDKRVSTSAFYGPSPV
jgi:hypothetical protein